MARVSLALVCLRLRAAVGGRMMRQTESVAHVGASSAIIPDILKCPLL